MENCIYKFIGKNEEVLYIGKADNLKHRLSGHSHLPSECYKRIKKILYSSFNSKGDRDLAEIYYISKYKPVYNQVSKYDVTIDIKEFDKLEFHRYVGRKKPKEDKTQIKSIIKNLEKYVKYNSFDNYTSKSGEKWYRVRYSFVQNEIEVLSEKGVYTEWQGCECTVRFGKTYDVPSWLVYSEEDKYSFYIYCEEEKNRR